jgi:hypothetical protein
VQPPGAPQPGRQRARAESAGGALGYDVERLTTRQVIDAIVTTAGVAVFFWLCVLS